MANVVQIILKGTDLTGPAMTSSVKRMNDVAVAAGKMFGVLAGAAAVGAVASLTKAFIDNTAEAIKNAEAMGILAQKAGMPVEEFSQLTHVASLAEVSQQNLITSSKKLSEVMVAQGRGSESVTAQLIAQADVFAKMQDGAEKTALAIQLFGRSGQNLIPLLNQGSDAIRRQMQQADALGKTISGKFAGEADQMGDNLQILGAAFDGLFNQIGQQLAPSLLQLTIHMSDFVSTGDRVAKTAGAIVGALNGMADVAKRSGSFWQALLDPMGTAGHLLVGANRGIKEQELINERGQDLPSAIIQVAPMGMTKEVLDGWSKRHADTLQKALDMERQFREEQLIGSAAQRLQIDNEYQARLEKIDALGLAEDAYRELSEQAWAAHHQKLIQLAETEKDRKHQIQQQILQSISFSLGNLATVSKAFGKKGFEAYKAFASAQAVIDSFAAANAAYKAMAGIPIVGPALGAVAAATALAAGMANVATINSQKAQAHSGLDYVPENATYALERGEGVIKANQNARLTRMLDAWEGSGGRGSINVNIGETPLAELIYQMSRDGRLQISQRSIA